MAETKAQREARLRLEEQAAADAAGTSPVALDAATEPPPDPTGDPAVDPADATEWCLVPAEWSVDAVEFPYGDDGEYMRVARDSSAVYTAAEANKVIRAAVAAGTPIVKEPVA
jgi:hypothetical protein